MTPEQFIILGNIGLISYNVFHITCAHYNYTNVYSKSIVTHLFLYLYAKLWHLFHNKSEIVSDYSYWRCELNKILMCFSY